MKKYIIYIGLLAVGLLLGWLLFGGSSNQEKAHDHNEAVVTNQMWTCSMHPNVMQPGAGDCPICGMDLIPAEAGADGLAAEQFKLTENAMALANIQTTKVGNGANEDNLVKLSGKLVENEEANAMLVSHFSGRIEKLAINATGETIRNGQVVAQIYSPELFAAQQELITSASLKESQPALYKAVRKKLKIKKLTEHQINQIEESGIAKETMPIYTAISGTVMEKLVEEGNHVIQGQPLFRVNTLNTVWANFDVYESQIDLFKKGQEVSVSVSAYPNKEFKGKVDFINPVLDSKTRTVTLRVVLDNKNNLFKPGMFVEAKISGAITTNENVLKVPSSAVLWTGKRSVVYVKTNPNSPVFEMRDIVLGNQVGNQYQVIEGLIVGDEIVTNGAFTVDAAAQLQGKKSMMNKEGKMVMTGHEGYLGGVKTTSETNGAHLNTNERLSVPTEFQNQLNTVFNNYIDLKDALVIDDANKVRDAAKSLANNLGRVDMKLLTDNDAHTNWMLFQNEIKAAAVTISNTSDIKVQRNHFKPLSTHLINAIQRFGVNKEVFVEFCPMADNDNGAYWLSKEKKILNPYFGEAMLSCGEVTQIIKK